MSNHDIQEDSDEKFVPLKDNNNNLSGVKIICSIVLLGVLVFCITTGVQYAGAYLQNEQQMEFKKEHQRHIKDSDENKILATEVTEEAQETEKQEREEANGPVEDKSVKEMKEQERMDKEKMDAQKAEEHKMEQKKMEDKKMEHK